MIRRLLDNFIALLGNELFCKSRAGGYATCNPPGAVMTESKEKIASGELKAKSYYDFANEDEYQKLLDSVAP